MSRLTKSCPESPARVWSSQSLCTYKLISANNFWLVWSLVKSMRTLKLNPTTQLAIFFGTFIIIFCSVSLFVLLTWFVIISLKCKRNTNYSNEYFYGLRDLAFSMSSQYPSSLVYPLLILFIY